MGNSKGKPGVMFYFDYIPALKMLTDEQRGKLLLGLICYANDGTDPMENLDLITQTMWIIMKPIIDRDDENYRKKADSKTPTKPILTLFLSPLAMRERGREKNETLFCRGRGCDAF